MSHFSGEIKYPCWTRGYLESLITARLSLQSGQRSEKKESERNVVPSLRESGSSALLMMVGASRAARLFCRFCFFLCPLQQQFSSSKQH